MIDWYISEESLLRECWSIPLNVVFRYMVSFREEEKSILRPSVPQYAWTPLRITHFLVLHYHKHTHAIRCHFGLVCPSSSAVSTVVSLESFTVPYFFHQHGSPACGSICVSIAGKECQHMFRFMVTFFDTV